MDRTRKGQGQAVSKVVEGGVAVVKKTVGIDEASFALGISKEALRKRIARGSVKAVKDQAGRWKVEVDDTGQDNRQAGRVDNSRALIEQLRSENEFLRQELYRKDHIILNLTEGIKLLEEPKKRGPSLWERMFKKGEKERRIIE
jgi:hypothetical protein